MRNEADLLAILEPAPVATSRPLRAAAMSALPPTTDIAQRQLDVRFVPGADIGNPVRHRAATLATP